jgi:2-amino-4-hydroxy-6-hydroxymethyldihydropteridine diphosphokinase/dihydropteroate synthase
MRGFALKERIYLGLGSNEGNRVRNLETAVRHLKESGSLKNLRVSPVYETPALLPENAPSDWNRPFLNLVIQAEPLGKTGENPETLLARLKEIEASMGRAASERWAPRLIDIDLLLWGETEIRQSTLEVPHPRLLERAFVLDPLKELDPTLKLPIGNRLSSLLNARLHPQHSAAWMGIINVAPDSFSEGLVSGQSNWDDVGKTEDRLDLWDSYNVAYLDVGAESTRPGAILIDPVEEATRIRPALERLRLRYQGKSIKPLISVDTRHWQTAALALELGADIINDVSGGQDPQMIDLVAKSHSTFVLMHNLVVPPKPGEVLKEGSDPIVELLGWFKSRTQELESRGVAREKIILDPGVGFGKSSLQSLQILRNLERLAVLPYRILVGHSRKSFLNPFTPVPAADRDLESIGVSLGLVSKGVDILRVHDPIAHIRAARAWNHLQNPK